MNTDTIFEMVDYKDIAFRIAAYNDKDGLTPSLDLFMETRVEALKVLIMILETDKRAQRVELSVYERNDYWRVTDCWLKNGDHQWSRENPHEINLLC